MIDQGEFFDIPSPCKRICELNNKGYCKGCFRSRDERLYWNQFTNFQKQLIVNTCEKRRLKVLAAKQASLEPVLPEEPIPQLDMFEIAAAVEAAKEALATAPADHHSSTIERLPDVAAETTIPPSPPSPRKPGEQFDLF